MPRITRRALLAAVAGLSFHPHLLSAQARRAPKRSVLSVNLRSPEMRPVSVETPTTYELTLPLEADASALRIGLGNITPTPYRLDGICVSQSDGWQPKTTPGWVYPSFSSQKASIPDRSAPGPWPVEVPANSKNATGATNVPTIIWSDWIDYETHATERPQLVLRALIPVQTLPMVSAGGLEGRVDDPVTGKARLIGERCFPGDYVTDPKTPLPSPQSTPFAPIFAIQYRIAVPGVQIVIGGDSHLAAWTTFIQLAAWELSHPTRPIAVWNAAWGGQPSNTFWPCLDEAIFETQPSICVIQGWTANDGMNPIADNAYLDRVRESVRRTVQSGAIPIIVKGLPRDLFGKPELVSWLQINKELDLLSSQALVFDPDPYVEDPTRAGNWLPQYSRDAIHASFAGNQDLAQPFERLLEPLL